MEYGEYAWKSMIIFNLDFSIENLFRVHYNLIIKVKIIIQVILFLIFHLVKVVDNIHQEIYMKVCGLMENDMVMVYFLGVMVMVNIWDNG